jgi:CheY-like chemotaxis protein
MRMLHEQDPLRDQIDMIRKAAESAATLTRQLLAFSRQQVLRPTVVDVNAVVRETQALLDRLIGEDVELAIELAPGVHPIEADNGQLEQVIVNLAVNARDAMPAGGRLVLATANVEIGPDAAVRRPDLQPGPYATLSVSDTGEGMDAETLRQIFEPFFTTKAEGQGTGLGLATVFGIVKQSGGEIDVQSEPGRGTTFTIYLPRAQAPVVRLDVRLPAPRPPRGTETILLVEDEEVVRHLEREVLVTSGYTVLEATGPMHALELSRGHPGAIDLLFTDRVMPEMGGDELARLLAAERPEMKVVFASGYAADVIAKRGMLSPDAAFLPKPLTPAALATKVREVLDDVALPRAS